MKETLNMLKHTSANQTNMIPINLEKSQLNTYTEEMQKNQKLNEQN